METKSCKLKLHKEGSVLLPSHPMCAGRLPWVSADSVYATSGKPVAAWIQQASGVRIHSLDALLLQAQNCGPHTVFSIHRHTHMIAHSPEL
eukprot:1153391-Pelagomonas_calceolata.AAC.21